jgi:hypothetical protein
VLVPGQVFSHQILSFIRNLDTPEIHGYQPDFGYRVYTAKAIECAVPPVRRPPMDTVRFPRNPRSRLRPRRSVRSSSACLARPPRLAPLPCRAMVTPRVPTGDGDARASDSLQAAYFRGALADQRALLAAEIAEKTRKLACLSTTTDSLAISRLRRQIRVDESEQRELDRMIAAIDRRFSANRVNEQ